MSTIERNILANFLGQGWIIVINAVAVPFYIKLMGIEAYGLVGFYLTVQAIFNYFLDFGISTTINREIARYSAFPDKKDAARNIVRTLGVIYWLIGVFLGMAVMIAARWIASNWINPQNLPVDTVTQTLMVMGLVVIFQWPLTFYQGALIGLQEMVLLNRLNALGTTFRTLGALIVLWLISPTILAFFAFQVVASLLQVLLTALYLWRKIPASDIPARFDITLLKDVWHFAVGMSLTSFLSFFLSQADRIVLSKVVTLEMFGYYTVAATANSALRVISSQISTAIFPRFSTLVAKEDQDKLRHLYHKGAQFTSAVVIPVALVASFFSGSLLLIWTQDAKIAAAAAPVVTLLFMGTAINSLLGMPYNLTVAHGWSSYGVYQNLIAVILFIPLMIVLASHYGSVGAATAWLVLNLGYLFLMPPIIHRRFLKKELWRWYFADTGIPLAVGFASSSPFYFLRPEYASQLSSFIYFSMAGLVTLLFVSVSLKEVRLILRKVILERWMGKIHAR